MVDAKRKVWGSEKELELESGLKVKIRQWSTGKLFHCLGLIAEVAGEGLDGVFDRDAGRFDIARIATNLVGVIGTKTHIVLDLVSTSAVDVGPQEVNEWLPGDLFEVLSEIVEQNFTDSAGKKFERLLGTILARSAKTIATGSQEESGSSG